MRRALVVLLFLMIVAPSVAASAEPAPAPEAEAAEPVVVRYPPDDAGVKTLAARQQAQERTRPRFRVPLDLRFTDRQPESGIDFLHESVDDSLKNWIPVHYDHGNGVAVADVDGDELYDVYLPSQLGSNRLYRNLGEGRFEDVTERAGVGLADRISVSASFADVDNDGDRDLFVTTVRMGNVLFLNDGTGRFRDATEEAGLGYSGHSSGAVFFDYDRDGLLDLFVVNVGVYTTDEKGPGGFYRGIDSAFMGHRFPERSERSILYRNLGGARFRDVTAEVGLLDTSWSGDAAPVDLDGDLYPELYVLNMQGDDHYWVNEGGERFVERGAAKFPRTPWGAMGVKFFDYDNDGRLDLLLTDMHSDMHDMEVNPLSDEKLKYDVELDDGENNIPGNAFYEQQEDGSFEEISGLVGAENFWPWGLSVGDLNADGWLDAFLASSMNFPFRYGINTVLVNNAGEGFLDAEFLVGVEPRRDGRTHKALFSVDCTGPDAQHVVCTTLKAKGKVTVEGAVGTRASALFDLDRDGDLDIVTNEFNDVPQVLVSDLAQQRPDLRWLEVVLEGRRSNRDGLGARVVVTAGDRTFTQVHDGVSGYLSHSVLPLYFGLGAAERVDRVEVHWPSGIRQTVTAGLAPNRRVTIVEEVPAGEEAPPADAPADGDAGGGAAR